MKLKHLLATFIILVGLTAIVLANANFALFNVTAEGSYPFLTWKLVVENGVVGYDVERSTRSDFRDAMSVSFHDANGDNHIYTWTDNTAFKQSIKTFYYRIRVMMTDDSYHYSEIKWVTVNQSEFSQTWGSLKAMFR